MAKKTKKPVARKGATKKAAKKTAKKAVKSKKSAKATTKKVTRKAVTKKSATKKASGKKASAKKTTTKKAGTKKRTAKKAATKKAAGKNLAIANSADGQMITAVIQGLALGDTAPDIVRAATGGKNISLRDLLGRKIVLYFYPKDDTPGCTIEGQDFTRLHEEFKATDCEVLGVSRDSVNSHEKFCSKFAFTFTLLSDEDEQLCNSFGVIKDKNMYGKMVRGIERSTFVIDRNGVIRREWRKVSVDGHAAEVLDFVKSLE